MKKAYLFILVLLLPVQAMAIEKDSVYSWGAWAKGIQPSAGHIARVTPPPARKPEINFRPNEAGAFNRKVTQVTTPVATPVTIAPLVTLTPPIPVAPTPVPTTPSAATPSGDPRTRGRR